MYYKSEEKYFVKKQIRITKSFYFWKSSSLTEVTPLFSILLATSGYFESVAKITKTANRNNILNVLVPIIALLSKQEVQRP